MILPIFFGTMTIPFTSAVMQAYDKYKDSGVEWLGEIPEHWEVKRIKNFTNVYNVLVS